MSVTTTDLRPVVTSPRRRRVVRARVTDSRDAETMPASSSCDSGMPSSTPSPAGRPVASASSAERRRCNVCERPELDSPAVGIAQPADEATDEQQHRLG